MMQRWRKFGQVFIFQAGGEKTPFITTRIDLRRVWKSKLPSSKSAAVAATNYPL